MKHLNTLSRIVGKLGRPALTVQKHSPALLFGAGVVGVAATVVLACRGTLKLSDILEDAQEKIYTAKTLNHPKYSEKERQRDITLVYVKTVIQVAKIYGPAVIVGIASISALTGAHIVLTRRNAALTAAYAAMDKALREYRKRVVDEFGPQKDAEFMYGADERTIVEETDQGPVTKTIKMPRGTSMYARFFDESNRNWKREHAYNQLYINCQQNWANDLLNSRGHVFLNEVYDMLGMERSKEGQIVGWVRDNVNGDGKIDFGVFDGDMYSAIRFVNGDERSVLLDFNVDGNVLDLI